MEGVVVSRQICLIASAIRQRLVFETIWSLIGSNRCQQRSTTSKPAMQSDANLFQYHSLFATIFLTRYSMMNLSFVRG
ncbi:hypothetical protein [Lapidilactobacillus wuchangensis]|uniref:hypothetical protein n=1 Tax=Lapidilactobacillus wuchangensis TaxID=2486001 RepID=UPI0013DE0F96|nr:hypothetical protein [Lapidilactobacillus wuchangensis]